MDASHVYVSALVLGCFYSHISEGAGQLRGDKEYPFSGVTKSGRVWRGVPESDARSVTKCCEKVARATISPHLCILPGIQVQLHSDCHEDYCSWKQA